VRVFLSETRDGIFHPKLCWFRAPKHTIYVVGSGNLTPGGLRNNREGFTFSELGQRASKKLQNTWASWLKTNECRLFPLNHPDVLSRAKMNVNIKLKTHIKDKILIENDAGDIIVGKPRNTDKVLIAEIPKSGNRWNQANFDLKTFIEFFGATPGKTQRIILTHIDISGKTGSEEVRPSVTVKSHNFRFEIEAANGKSYPKNGRPICIFVRIATRTFRYRLLMPGTPTYDSAKAYLSENCPPSIDSLTRYVTSVSNVTRELFFLKLGSPAKPKKAPR
jgi:hypothetical protein